MNGETEPYVCQLLFYVYCLIFLAVIHQFNEVNFGLTARVMSILYGEQFGSKEIEINFALYERMTL
jgi:hypothetical protein